MSDDLVKRLRGKKLNCICAAKSASECCCNTDWPESSCNEAADAIEAQAKRISDLEHLIGNLNDELAQLRKLFEMCAQLAEAHKGCEISRSEGMPCETGKELAVAIRKLGGIQ